MRIQPKPCWGRSGAAVCTSCALLQMPADYTGSFPVLDLQLPAVEHIGTDAEFCAERRRSGTHFPDASVSGEAGSVCAAAYVRHGTDSAPPDPHGVAPGVQGQITKSEAREQQQLRAGFCHHEEGAS